MHNLADDVIGAWMKRAEASGELENNPYRGKKLDLDDDKTTPPELRMGMRILKNAGVTPPAVDMANAVANKRQQLAAATDDASRNQLRQELIDLELKYRVALDSLNRL